MFDEHLALLLERFPKAAFPLSFHPKKAAQPLLLAPLPPHLETLDLLYVFGWDLAIYNAALPWLSSSPLRELVFLDDDLDSSSSFLAHPQAKNALQHPQVFFSLLPNGRGRKEKIREVTREHPAKLLDVIGCPSYEKKRSKALKTLRLSLLRSATLAYALHLDRLHGERLFSNWLKGLAHLPTSSYANKMKGAFKGTPAVLCGAGPSLESSIEDLRRLEHSALIIAGGSTIAALGAHGIAPHFAMAVDPNIEELHRFENNLNQEVPLLFSPRVFPGIFDVWNGPLIYLRAGLLGFAELWMEEELKLLEPLIGGGELSDESISVTSLCLAFAHFLGCDPIIFNGLDLAYTQGKRYASGVGCDDTAQTAYSAADRLLTKKDRKGRPIQSAVRWVMEASSLSSFIKKHPETRFFNATQGGLPFPGAPDLPLSSLPTESHDLRGLIHQALIPMPADTASILQDKLQHLQASLERTLKHLDTLSTSPIDSGAYALAFYEVKEEDAYLFLFQDLYSTVQTALRQSPDKNQPSTIWKALFEIAKKYQSYF